MNELRAEPECTMAQLIDQHQVVEIMVVDDFVMPTDREIDNIS